LVLKAASVRKPRYIGYARFGSRDARFNRKRFAAGLAAGAEIEPGGPRRSRRASPSGRIGGCARSGGAPML